MMAIGTVGGKTKALLVAQDGESWDVEVLVEFFLPAIDENGMVHVPLDTLGAPIWPVVGGVQSERYDRCPEPYLAQLWGNCS